MTILVIGNGYDKALGLPTDYADFLKFANYIKEFTADDNHNRRVDPVAFGMDSRIIELINKDCGNIPDNLFSRIKDIKPLCHTNFWLEYFLEKQEILEKQEKNRWVDFETEITKQISLLENVVNNAVEGIDNEYETYDLEDIESFYSKNSISLTTYRDVHDKLLRDLDNLTWLMGFYFAKFVEKIDVAEAPIEIRNILNGTDEIKVISFNYTHFLEKYLKNNGKKYEIDYVHGVADITKSVGTNNMVLGAAVGEDNIDFADFKKYFQRILKKTGHKYIEWIENNTNNSNTINKSGANQGTVPIDRVFFFGHSMDLTDGDIIKKLVMAPNTWTTIHCFKKNEQDHRDIAQKIKNMQAIITRDELIKRTSEGGTLRFV